MFFVVFITGLVFVAVGINYITSSTPLMGYAEKIAKWAGKLNGQDVRDSELGRMIFGWLSMLWGIIVILFAILFLSNSI